MRNSLITLSCNYWICKNKFSKLLGEKKFCHFFPYKIFPNKLYILCFSSYFSSYFDTVMFQKNKLRSFIFFDKTNVIMNREKLEH